MIRDLDIGGSGLGIRFWVLGLVLQAEVYVPDVDPEKSTHPNSQPQNPKPLTLYPKSYLLYPIHIES